MVTTNEIANSQAEPKKGHDASVAVEDLQKSFGNHKVLNGVTLSVDRGETLAVLGRSGTGKSVLLRIIIGWKLRTRDRSVSVARILPAWLWIR